MLKEFKDFIARGNVIDMAVGIVMGAAFTAIVNGTNNAAASYFQSWYTLNHSC